MSVCRDCPLRLFNTKHYNLHGIGNPYAGKCIVVPNVDYNAYKEGDMGFSSQVEIIRQSLSFTGELENLNTFYIVPLIRCNDKLGCELTNDIYSRCITYFANDVKVYNFKHILLLGEAARKFLNCDIKDNINNIFLSRNARFYAINYSPLVKYTNERLFEEFEIKLKHWYTADRLGYNNYNIRTI